MENLVFLLIFSKDTLTPFSPHLLLGKKSSIFQGVNWRLLFEEKTLKQDTEACKGPKECFAEYNPPYPDREHINLYCG